MDGLVIVDSNPDWSSEDHSQKQADWENGKKRESDSVKRTYEEREVKQAEKYCNNDETEERKS